MGKLYRLNRARTETSTSAFENFFTRVELQQLLDLYARRVASGEWRDYAIDQHAGATVFSVFRHTHEQPLFSIAKRAGEAAFDVYSGHCRLKRTGSLNEALSLLENRRKLRVIS